jgi:omega-6 fatty acid desaturase (delta-12 desaturase)
VWLFYVQHQFEDTYWEHTDDWEYAQAALQGSSYYKLPKVLQWFTGNIGLHHIHHLSSRIPNYALQQCHDDNPEFQQVSTLTLLSSQRLVGFGHLKTLAVAN